MRRSDWFTLALFLWGLYVMAVAGYRLGYHHAAGDCSFFTENVEKI